MMRVVKRQIQSSSRICSTDHTDKACSYIRSAMAELALCDNSDVCRDSIANLSVVLLDLCPEDAVTNLTC